MTDDEIALWLITKGTMEDKPVMALAANRILTLRTERDRLREAMDYILDGMGIAEPDYVIDPDDDFLDAANSEWVRDTLTRLAAALKGETP